MQLFSAEAPVPVSTTSGGYHAAPSTSGPAGFGNVSNTLDEPIWETVKRDIVRIYRNLIMVVFPFKDRSQQSAALRNWDLWGPMVFTLTLAVTLSIGAAKPSSTFSVRRPSPPALPSLTSSIRNVWISLRRPLGLRITHRYEPLDSA